MPILYAGSHRDGYTLFGKETVQLHEATSAPINELLLVPGSDHGVDLLSGAKATPCGRRFWTSPRGPSTNTENTALRRRTGGETLGTVPRPRLVISLAVVVALALPASASAWKYVFQDFLDSQGGGVAAAHAVAKKCHGGKLGNYDFVSRVHAEGGDTEITHVVTATLPVTTKWEQLKHIDLTIHASDNFPTDVLLELQNAYGEFWDGVFVKYKPDDGGELHIRHPDLVVFGNTLLESDRLIQEFKPKQGC
jgi:hypothetical protein